LAEAFAFALDRDQTALGLGLRHIRVGGQVEQVVLLDIELLELLLQLRAEEPLGFGTRTPTTTRTIRSTRMTRPETIAPRARLPLTAAVSGRKAGDLRACAGIAGAAVRI
jgi:hypothetical protein